MMRYGWRKVGWTVTNISPVNDPRPRILGLVTLVVLVQFSGHMVVEAPVNLPPLATPRWSWVAAIDESQSISLNAVALTQYLSV